MRGRDQIKGHCKHQANTIHVQGQITQNEHYCIYGWIPPIYMGVSKNRGKTSKMDGENNGTPLLKWMIWEYPYFWKYPYEPGSKLLVLGMVIQPLIGNPYNGYIKPYYWVDEFIPYMEIMGD